ncbi:MAG: ATPase [Actinobacteria bacterium 13_1_20CM_2_65_11]|nr:MAG: ATPase [Chloroflexi bacterium 13_1_40CM_65_17]OLC68036.1 MAG: ATPase [Actinobacteria bacterium 13_1_40CM_4_65_12]OLE77941.1 MAG: ATPase [Actinobacteria bacterium 13_1_20CM_2_65_11]
MIPRTLPLVRRWESLLVVLLVAFIVLGSSLSPFFLSGSNFSDLTSNLMEKAIMALPLALIIIAGEIDLSVESMLGLSSALLGFTYALGWPLWLDIPLVLIVGATGGLLNGLLVTRAGLPSLVVTLGTLALYRGLASVVLGPRSVSGWPEWFTNFGFNDVPGTLIPWPALVFAVLALAFLFVLHRTWIGRQIYAIGKNKEAARYAGIDVARMKTALFILSGVLSALAGVILTARFSSARADNGQGFVLDVVTSVLLGGVNIFGGEGTIVGVVLAIFVIGVLRNGLTLADVSPDTQSVAVGALLILSVAGPTLVRRISAARPRRQLTKPVSNS